MLAAVAVGRGAAHVVLVEEGQLALEALNAVVQLAPVVALGAVQLALHVLQHVLALAGLVLGLLVLGQDKRPLAPILGALRIPDRYAVAHRQLLNQPGNRAVRLRLGVLAARAS